jgi:anthranilate phosphoribosyltransferase
LTTAGSTTVAEFKDGRVRQFEVMPEEIGLPRVTLDALRGGEPQHNAALMRNLLGGAAGPLRDVVLLNSAAALVVAGRATAFRDGMTLAGNALDSGAASQVLDRLIAETNR